MLSDIPHITLDFKQDRIRIHKNTLKLLGSPNFIRFLVNPVDKVIAIQVSDAEDSRAHRSSRKRLKPNQSYELRSRNFMQQLIKCGTWDTQKTYRLDGTMVVGGQIAKFNIADSICITDRVNPTTPISKQGW